MEDKIPSAEKMQSFIADASPDHVREITAVRWLADESQFNGHFCPDRREHAARFLCDAWDRKVQWWNARFSGDEVLEWLLSMDSVKRAWTRTQRRNRGLPPPENQDRIDFWRKVIDRRLSRWASKVIEGGRQTRLDMPLNSFWLERKSGDAYFGWHWLHGVASALYDYLYTDSAGELIRERQAIRKMHADALNGIRALEAFMGTQFSQSFKGLAFWGSSGRQSDQTRRMAIEAIGNVDFDAFYPSKRHDTTVAERLLVASLSDLHCEIFKSPKPEAIAEIMNSPFIRNPLDMRGIERLCATRRSAKASIRGSIMSAHDDYIDARQKTA